jgi:two-component system sensor kinase FixL
MGNDSAGKRSNKNSEIAELLILREAVENTNEAFVTIDENHSVVFFNKTAEKIFGFSREEILGHDLNTILSPRCSQDHRLAVARYLKTREPKLIGHESEFTAVRKSGENFPAAISFSVAGIGGRLFFTALVRDMTETRALQQQALRSERLAALGQLVAEITHEIKNPLTIIGGFARQLKKTISGEKALGKLNIVVEETERLENLLLELRELYLPKSLVLSDVAINELLHEVYRMTKDDCAQKEMQSTLETSADAGFVEGDKGKLKQVLLNLVKNAVEAIGAGGNLSLRSAMLNDTVTVIVSDDGPGVSEGDQEKLFSPFFTTKKHGSGLGLCICKRIIEEHQGCSMSLVSQEGKGTEVTLTFPSATPIGDIHEANKGG